MAKPVKTLVLDAIETALKTITQIEQNSKQPKRGQGIPIDQDTAVYPWACFFDEPESIENRNRISRKTFELIIQAWVKEGTDTISDQMDLIDAEIEKTLLTNAGVAYQTMDIAKISSDKLYIDDRETGILQTVYRVVYGHKYKDPYDPVKGP
jgi:hypothetical protein